MPDDIIQVKWNYIYILKIQTEFYLLNLALTVVYLKRQLYSITILYN